MAAASRSLLLAALLSVQAHATTIDAPLPDVERPPATSASSPLQSRMIQGYAALGRKDFDAARGAFTEASKLDPRAAGPLVALAEVARQQKDSAQAERWLRRALEVAPDSAEAQRAWGRYRFSVKDYAGAEAALSKAAQLDPKAAATQSDLGDLYLNWLKRPADAAAAYRRLSALKPEDSGAHFSLALALVAQGKNRDAEPEFERSAALAPDNPLPLTALGRLYELSAQPDKALAAFDRALKVDAHYAPALGERGDLHFKRKNYAKAAADYEQIVKQTPNDAMTVYKLGGAYQLMGKLDLAEREYRRALEADPKFAPALNNLAAMSAERHQNLDEALGWARQAVALEPTVADFQDTLGSVHLARGDADAAVSAYRKATSLAPKNAAFYYGLGEALAQKGDRKAAVAAFKTALSVDPSFARAADAQRRIASLGGN